MGIIDLVKRGEHRPDGAIASDELRFMLNLQPVSLIQSYCEQIFSVHTIYFFEKILRRIWKTTAFALTLTESMQLHSYRSGKLLPTTVNSSIAFFLVF